MKWTYDFMKIIIFLNCTFPVSKTDDLNILLNFHVINSML